MNISKLSHEQKIKLWFALQDSLKWYAIGVLCIDDVIDEMHNRGMVIPADIQLIADNCKYTAQNYEFNHSHVIDLVIENVEMDRTDE